jgi:signal transduction histidine kinase
LILASVMNFIVMSRLVLISDVDDYFISAGALGVIFFCISMLFAGWRYPVFGVRTIPDGKRAPSVVSVVLAGLYLLSFAILTWMSNLIGMQYERLGLMVVSAFFVFIILAVMISGKARRHLRIFVNENFRPGLYNYRREWRQYARLMTSSSTVDDLISNTVSSLCQTMMAKKGLVYAGIGGGKSSDYGLEPEEFDDGLPGRIMEMYDGSPMTVMPVFRRHLYSPGGRKDDGGVGDGIPEWIRAVSFLTIGGEARGFIAIGPKDFGRLWAEEDLEFLATITDQAALALENLLMEERYLESKQLESFNRFASFVIHDLKNTVGMLSLTAENARDNIHDKEFQEDAIDTVERSVQKMRRLIDSLNAHKAPAAVSRTMTDVSEAARERIASLEQLASKKDVTVTLDSSVDKKVHVDPSALSRIIENLVLNAIEAMTGGGTVNVSIALNGETLAIIVNDDGPGFDRDYLEEKLFRPFMSTKKNGLGVGLVLCKSLAEAHGGNISVSSISGGGTSVKVEMQACI